MANDDGAKSEGAFLTIGELSAELGVPSHILRYWETRFSALKPLQRAGKRRYYRPEDVRLARQIHDLLIARGFTVRGAQQALAAKSEIPPARVDADMAVTQPATYARDDINRAALQRLRTRLATALAKSRAV